MKTSSKFFWIYFFFLTFFFANILFLWIDQALYEKYFFGEDRIVEWLTFAGFFGAALTCIIIIRKNYLCMSRWRFLYFIGFAIFFFVCAGEEISWGQRILGFHTPEVMVKYNHQQEFNIHNLELDFFHPRDIMGIYVYLYGIILPLFFFLRKSSSANTWQRFIYHPLITLCFIWTEILNFARNPFCAYIRDKVTQTTFDLIINQIEESVEMYWAFSTLFGMIVIKNAWDYYAARKEEGVKSYERGQVCR